MKTIGVITNFEKSRAVEAIKHVASLASGMGFTIFAEERAAAFCPAERVCPVSAFASKGVEAVVVLGGDGTMLDAAHQVAGQGLPLMGLNIGSLGYLTSVEEHQFGDALQQLRENRYDVSPRSSLAVAVAHLQGERAVLSDALNDVVVSRGGTGHAVELELLLDDKQVARVLCDGIIVATPTGSTAYSLSTGGPVLLPDMSAFVICMICPHTLTARPLVTRDTVRIAIRALSCAVPMVVSLDGRDAVPLQKGDTVEIVRSPRNVPFIELHGYNPCDVLRRKLGWGER
ncbi:MAG TPA: NAD(+)/NADH kinase [Kiritimatiellia bacterium]|nr:NAD(+)/NADH kinase [Kiritimatiellia bacterium]HPS06456.1 NAD(+)/NADH kinase [Kiritimatiellia bacterium]